MKVKIIKRSEQEKVKSALPVAAKNPSKNGDERNSMSETVKSWIKDSRQKRKDELLLAEKFSKRDFCS